MRSCTAKLWPWRKTLTDHQPGRALGGPVGSQSSRVIRGIARQTFAWDSYPGQALGAPWAHPR